MAAFEGVAFLWVVVETHFFPQQKMKKKTPLPTPFSPHFTPPPPSIKTAKSVLISSVRSVIRYTGTEPRGGRSGR